MTLNLSAAVSGVGVAGPGLDDWASARAVLRGEAQWHEADTVIRPPDVLDARERRRTSPAMRLALNVALAACRDGGVDPAGVSTVFSSAVGSGNVTDRILRALATPMKQVSPTDFHNSVHNAAAGYWSIGADNHAPSISVAAGDYGFAAGLLRALAQVSVTGDDVLYVCYEHPFCEPLNSKRPFGPAMGLAMILKPGANVRATPGPAAEPTRPVTPGLDRLATTSPAARGLALLEPLARNEETELDLSIGPGQTLHIEVKP